MATVPEKVADPMFGSISMWYVSGSTVRGRRYASDLGAAGLGSGGISGEGYPRDRG